MNEKTKKPVPQDTPPQPEKPQAPKDGVKEIGGRGGLDPVRYGDWEIGSKCVDF